jgi:hypothetical protein
LKNIFLGLDFGGKKVNYVCFEYFTIFEKLSWTPRQVRDKLSTSTGHVASSVMRDKICTW